MSGPLIDDRTVEEHIRALWAAMEVLGHAIHAIDPSELEAHLASELGYREKVQTRRIRPNRDERVRTLVEDFLVRIVDDHP